MASVPQWIKVDLPFFAVAVIEGTDTSHDADHRVLTVGAPAKTSFHAACHSAAPKPCKIIFPPPHSTHAAARALVSMIEGAQIDSSTEGVQKGSPSRGAVGASGARDVYSTPREDPRTLTGESKSSPPSKKKRAPVSKDGKATGKSSKGTPRKKLEGSDKLRLPGNDSARASPSGARASPSGGIPSPPLSNRALAPLSSRGGKYMESGQEYGGAISRRAGASMLLMRSTTTLPKAIPEESAPTATAAVEASAAKPAVDVSDAGATTAVSSRASSSQGAAADGSKAGVPSDAAATTFDRGSGFMLPTTLPITTTQEPEAVAISGEAAAAAKPSAETWAETSPARNDAITRASPQKWERIHREAAANNAAAAEAAAAAEEEAASGAPPPPAHRAPEMHVDVKGTKGKKKGGSMRLNLKRAVGVRETSPPPPKFEPRATLAYYGVIGGGFGTPRIGVALGQFNVPAWMCVRPTGELVVSSTFAHEVQLLSARGAPVSVISRGYYTSPPLLESADATHAHSESVPLSNPQGLCISPDGKSLYVANVQNAGAGPIPGCVQRYELNSSSEHEIDARPVATSTLLSELDSCHGMCLVDNALFVAASGKKQITVLSATDLKVLFSFGKAELLEPMDVDVYQPPKAQIVSSASASHANRDPRGRPPPLLMVTDRERHKVFMYSTDGFPVSSFGHEGIEPGAFKEPLGIAIREQRVFVSEGLGARLQVLEPNGTPLLVLPAPTGGRLCGLSWHQNRLYVGELEAHRVHSFKIID